MDEAPTLTPAHRDRRTGLMVFGILEIGLGFLCVLAAGAMMLGQVLVARQAGTPVRTQIIIPGLLLYAGLAVAFVWLGIGSIQCRRWARALLLILGWVWLGMGVLMVPMMAWLMPKILASAPPPPGAETLPPAVMTLIVLFQILFLSVFFILLPGTLVLFYWSRHVKLTCDVRDPIRRWTDSCPLPDLAVACFAWCSAAMMLSLPLAKLAMFPLFGTILTGLPAFLLVIAMAGVMFWIGHSWYRLKVAGWWTWLGLLLVLIVSNLLTFSRVDIIEVYQKMGYPQEQIDLIRKQGWMTSRFIVWSSLFCSVPMVAYILWVKRFFQERNPPAPNQ